MTAEPSVAVDAIARQIVDAAVKVDRALGPGLLESAYQVCLAYELSKRGLRVRVEVPLKVVYEDVQLDSGYRIDMIVEECVVIENKSVDEVIPLHEAQLLTYLKLSKITLGFLITWNVKLVKDGIKRMVLSV